MGAVVLAIYGSLRKRSFTEKLLDLCIEGMGAGLELHKFYPHQMNIGPCNSCWSCWGSKSLGECVQKKVANSIVVRQILVPMQT